MRTPRQSAGNVEPNYYDYFGPSIFRLSQLEDKEDNKSLTVNELQEKYDLLRKIPSYLLLDWNDRREKNLRTNEQLIDMTYLTRITISTYNRTVIANRMSQHITRA